MSTTTPAVTIDHTGYPNIIDKIVNHSDADALLALRGTSQAFRARCDRLLFHHAVIDLSDEDKRRPPRTADDARNYRGTDDRVAKSVKSRSCSGVLPPLYRKVRILDHVTEHHPPLPVARRFTQIHTLRRTNRAWALMGPAMFYPSDVVVDFIDVATDLVGYMYRSVIKIPLKTERRVMHFHYDPAVDIERRIGIEVYNEVAGACDFTFVLWAESVPDAPPAFLSMALRSAVLTAGDRLNDTLHPTLTITVVLQHGLDPADMDRWFQRMMQPRPYEYHVRDQKALRNAMRFITIDEWWAELGEAKDVEGVWPQALA
ncbi:uncharacterized protein LOC62_04G005335 [Vanrija pseudolonga]|uniref:Uncharacterized protein n=1 Tax=Vanrija pseudolonga TaxID=143232 RepID=A0AAF0Y8E1_9TREE|nr:hypothetical protein LOC62_04G005335 [Vanrija pseudolonga]